MESPSSPPITSTFSHFPGKYFPEKIMDRVKTQTGASTLSKSYLLVIKKSIKFAISFSLFSFLVSYFSPITLFLKQSNSSYFTIQIFSHGLDKNCMFLLCNGILVLLAKSSGLIGGEVSGDHFTDNGPVRSPEKTEQGSEADVGDNGFLIPIREDRENGFLNLVGEDRDGEGTESMSAEELNKKCDEFIKKMKEGIKLESQTLVVR